MSTEEDLQLQEDRTVLNIALVGNFAVGKTSILHRYINNEFKSEYICTLGRYCLWRHSLHNMLVFSCLDLRMYWW